MLHRTRHLFIRQQTAVINSIRAQLAFWRQGPQSVSNVNRRLSIRPGWMGSEPSQLGPRTVLSWQVWKPGCCK